MLMKGFKEQDFIDMNISNLVKASIEVEQDKLEQVEKSLDEFLEFNTDLVVSKIRQENNKMVFDVGERKNKKEEDRIKNKIEEFYGSIKTDFKIDLSKIKLEKEKQNIHP